MSRWWGAVWVVVCLVVGGLAWAGPSPVQEITWRVLDSRDRPVAGAEIHIQARAGRPQGRGPWRTDARGELRLVWRPRVVDRAGGRGIRDELVDLVTRLDYRVEKRGCFPALGRVEDVTRRRRMASPELADLGRSRPPRPLVETVVLRRWGEALGGELAVRGGDEPMVRRLLAFYQQITPVARHLGVVWAWPGFVLEKGELRLRFRWRGAPWVGLTRAPLRLRVALSAGVPLLLAAGQGLLPLSGVGDLGVEVACEVSPADDPHALARQVTVVVAAPVGEVERLARGEVSADRFLERHPPRQGSRPGGGEGR